jgi:hypothetical protein
VFFCSVLATALVLFTQAVPGVCSVGLYHSLCSLLSACYWQLLSEFIRPGCLLS